MKKFMFLSLILFSLVGHAQKNAIKLSVANTQIGDFNINYERVLTQKNSINFNIGYWDLSSSYFDVFKYLSNSDPDDIQFLNFRGKVHTSLDYRTYLGQKGAMRGLYIAPYLRYWGHGADLSDIMFSEEYDNDFKFDIDTKINSFGAGFQIGYQWIIREHINIDFYFIGLGLERMTISGKFKSNIKEQVYNTESQSYEDLNYAYFEESVEDAFEGINLIAKNAKIKTTDDYLLVKIPLWLPGIRTGFTIGYSF